MPTPNTTTTAGRAHRRYTIALCKGAALLDETQTLLRHWTPGEEIAHFVDRVQRDNVLAQVTAYRTKDIVRRVFARRFLLPTDVPAGASRDSSTTAFLADSSRKSFFCTRLERTLCSTTSAPTCSGRPVAAGAPL